MGWWGRRRGHPRVEGELALQFAVLEDAIRLLREGPSGQREVWEEARAWLEAPGRDHPFDFESLCDALTIDAEALRVGVLAEIKAPPAGRERPRPLRIGPRRRIS